MFSFLLYVYFKNCHINKLDNYFIYLVLAYFLVFLVGVYTLILRASRQMPFRITTKSVLHVLRLSVNPIKTLLQQCVLVASSVTETQSRYSQPTTRPTDYTGSCYITNVTNEDIFFHYDMFPCGL